MQKLLDLENNWQVDPAKKMIIKKRVPIVSTLLRVCGLNRTTMQHLYSMVKRGYLKHSILMGLGFPIEHDNMHKPKNFPFYYCLKDGWQIEKQSLPYITDGPLFSEIKGELLVEPKLLFVSFRKYIWPCICAFGTIIGVIKGVVWIFEALNK